MVSNLHDQLYDRIVELLGKRLDDPAFTQLAHDLSDEPHPMLRNEHKYVQDYLFRKSGFQVSYNKMIDAFYHAFFHHGSEMARSGYVSAYQGRLPAGIKFGEQPAEVAAKLGLKPSWSKMIPGCDKQAPKDLWEKYAAGPLQFTCIYRGPTSELNSVSITRSEFEIKGRHDEA